MKRVPSLFAILVLIPLLAFGALEARVDATLTLPHDVVLPGVPFDMTVTLKNVSKAPAAVGLVAHLDVTLPDGRKFTPTKADILEPRPLPFDEPWVELAPGESRTFYLSWDDAVPSLSHYPEFSGPGTYTLDLQLSAGSAPESYVGTVTTSDVRLTRTVSHGEDEELWDHMRAVANGRWADDSFLASRGGPELLREILAAHPTSSYYPYALVLSAQLRPIRPATKDDIPKALDAAAHFPLSPAYPHLLLRAGKAALSIAAHGARDRDAATSLEYFTRAERYFNDAAAKSKVEAVRAAADRGARIARDEAERQKRLVSSAPPKASQ